MAEKRERVRKDPLFPRAVKRLKDIDVEDYKDSVRTKAMNRWYFIVAYAPETCEVGRLLVTALGKMKTNSEIREFFENILAKKSTATLMKRSGSILLFISFCKKKGFRK